jgi:ribosomal RNA-processing protein 8
MALPNPPSKVYSFDLAKLSKHVIRANLARLPLKSAILDHAVFCLALMGTDYLRFIYEANRVLKY